ncbi:hypothetical protein SALBM217S_02926 [Streptomyces griseoloalbus]
MPPRAIRSQVSAAIWRAPSAPVRAWCRSRNSSTMDGGNFGAPPNPPRCASYSRVSPSSACASSCSPGTSSPPTDSSRPARSRVIFPATSPTSSRRSAQACATPSSTCRNDGMPWRGAGGK